MVTYHWTNGGFYLLWKVVGGLKVGLRIVREGAVVTEICLQSESCQQIEELLGGAGVHQTPRDHIVPQLPVVMVSRRFVPTKHNINSWDWNLGKLYRLGKRLIYKESMKEHQPQWNTYQVGTESLLSTTPLEKLSASLLLSCYVGWLGQEWSPWIVKLRIVENITDKFLGVYYWN